MSRIAAGRAATRRIDSLAGSRPTSRWLGAPPSADLMAAVPAHQDYDEDEDQHHFYRRDERGDWRLRPLLIIVALAVPLIFPIIQWLTKGPGDDSFFADFRFVAGLAVVGILISLWRESRATA